MPKAAILIVDDDPEAIRSFGPMLRRCGYEARGAFDADGAIEAIERQLPDAILLDLHLPVTDGIQLLRRFRAVDRLASIPVAVVTGDYLVDDEVTIELDALGARLHFKPLWEDDVLQIVGELLARDADRRKDARSDEDRRAGASLG